MLVSAIMPTRGRAEWARKAVECFQSQTWPDRELVIVDDADCPSFATPPEGEGIRYHQMFRQMTIGAKRNIAVSRAAGDVIIHFDDDDWSAPERMEDQVTRLVASGTGLTGYHSMIFEDIENKKRYKFDGLVGPGSKYALGTSMCYTRKAWQALPFPNQNKSEDNAVVFRSPNVVSVDAGDLMIARIHNGNTSEKREKLYRECWTEL